MCTSHLQWEPFFPASTRCVTCGWFTVWVQEIAQTTKEIFEPKHPILHNAQITCKKRPGEFKCCLLGYVFSLLHTDILITKQIINKKYQARPSQVKSLGDELKLVMPIYICGEFMACFWYSIISVLSAPATKLMIYRTFFLIQCRTYCLYARARNSSSLRRKLPSPPAYLFKMGW